MHHRRLALAIFLVLASLTRATAQELVRDLAGFNAIPTPQGVECKDSPGERQCEFKQTADGTEYTFGAGFLEQPPDQGRGRAFVLAVSPYAAARVESIARLYAYYAARLELHEKEALIGAIPSLADLPERCARSPNASKKDGVCILAAGESIIYTAPGATDRSGISITRQWVSNQP
jgi:hypothetical protein